MCHLADAPQELINTTTRAVERHATQTLYSKRTWTGRCSSPLLFAGQYDDAESGWAYNRFRYYNPTLGAHNVQDPLGLAPRLASAQGMLTTQHTGSMCSGCMAEVMLRKRKSSRNIARDQEALRTVHSTAARGQNSAMLVDTNGNRYFAHGASTDIPSSLSPTDIGLRDSDTFVRSDDIPGLAGKAAPPGQSGWCEIHAEQKLLSYAKQNNIQPAEMHSAYNFCSNRGGSIPGCEQVLSRNGLMTVSPQLDTAYPVRFTQDGLNIIRNGMR